METGMRIRFELEVTNPRHFLILLSQEILWFRERLAELEGELYLIRHLEEMNGGSVPEDKKARLVQIPIEMDGIWDEIHATYEVLAQREAELQHGPHGNRLT